ncbi:MAG: exodeoxyribonuclease VII large subunit [Acidobacteria bacterium]|nr:exodeoxyribonuclease VII large subunit [Acidobacteriota bacterium]
MNNAASRMMAALFAEQEVLTVGELTERIKDSLENEFFVLTVQGEISNYKNHQSGHWYFTLKDSEAQIRGVFFRQWNRLMRFEPENGLEVRVRGRLTVYEPRGEYQIVVETMEPVGVGALQLAFEQQVKKLAAEGLFDEARKRPLPLLPRRIGIVTSVDGAVVRDMLQVLERRNRGVHILIAPVKVQGTGAAHEIADAIRLLNQYSKRSGCEVDVIIIGRGGGSMEDLWAFNEEQVARAIFDSEIPVVSAVGHETDFTISDFVADFRAPTPSAAAELVTREASELIARVEGLQTSLSRAMNYYLLHRRNELRDLVESRGFIETARSIVSTAAKCREFEVRATDALKANLSKTRLKLHEAQQRLATTDLRAPLAMKAARVQNLELRLNNLVHRLMESRWHQLTLTASKLDILSPLSVLGRGYVLVRDEFGRLVSRADGLDEGQHLKLRFEDGEIGCRITEPKKTN